MRFLLVLAVSFSCVVSLGEARAQRSQVDDAQLAQAKAAFELGTRAYADGEFESALESFRRAYELTGSPDLLYNIATVSDRLRRDEEALQAYEGYLEARPKSADREHVEGRIEVLRQAIEANQRAELDAQIEARNAAIEAAARVKAERPLTQHVGPGPGPWIAIGVSGVAILSGAVLLGLGQRDEKSVQNAAPGSSYAMVQEMADRGPRLSKSGIALLSVGGAGVLGGVIWRLTGGHEEAMPEVSIGPTGISVKGRF
ncbi:MAG: tetratricopeptide repeat protein [Polyangiales bacterium]